MQERAYNPCIFTIRHSLSTLSEFHRYADSAVNSQKVEIDKIQQFVTRELDRQNALANGTKYKCEKKLHELQDILEEVTPRF